MNLATDHTVIQCSEDRYGGAIIDESTVNQPLEVLEECLVKLISTNADKKILWITLPINKSSYIPVFTKYGFDFYDCGEKRITLLKKLTDNPATPTATNHTIGVGAFIQNENDILVVKDNIYKTDKLPGGYIDNEENISQALKREVFEETGIDVEMESIVSIGHFYPGQFNESNIYIVCKAKALSTLINIVDSQEIIEAKWVSIDKYINSEKVHPYNKKIVAAAMHNKGIELEANDFFLSPQRQHEFFF